MTTPIVITALPAGSALGGTEAVPVVQTGVTVQVPASYFIAAAQPVNANLNALAALSGTGLYARTGSGTAATRTVTGTSGRLTVANGDGVSGNPTLDLASGVVSAGTYKSVTVDTYGRVTAGTNPTTLAGYGITDAQPLNAHLTALAALSTAQTTELTTMAGLTGTGLTTRTGTGTYAQRSVATASTGRITVSNGDGVAGNPTLDLASGIVTPGTYNSITFDTYGRATAGSNVSNQPLSTELTAVAGLNTTGLISRTGAGSYIPRTLTAGTNVSITNGDGISGNPTISATSAGITQSNKTTAYTLVAGDKGNLIAFTGSADTTFSFTAAATLGAGWWVDIISLTSDDTKILTLDPNASETIDGVTTVKEGFRGCLRVICDGSTFTTERISGGFIRFTASGTLAWPTNTKGSFITVYGGGGGGAGGTTGNGGSGAGGGAYNFYSDGAKVVNTSVTITIGAGGTAGTATNNGGDGGNSSFGTDVLAFGGAAGRAGGSAGGGGGGAASAGTSNNGGTPNAGLFGLPGGSAAGAVVDNIGFGGGAPSDSTGPAGSKGGRAEYGGGGGGYAANASTSGDAGSSLYGGGGGGGGAGQTGGAGGYGGGIGWDWRLATGGTPGATGATGAIGGIGASSLIGQGTGGGGGGGGNPNAGGAGGAGGTPGGAGGGGGRGASAGGAGGLGGRGECRVWYW